MFRQYWIEFATLMVMTLLLFMSFAYQAPPPPKAAGLQKRLNPYNVAKSPQEWIAFDYTEDKKAERSYHGSLLADGHWVYQRSGKPEQKGTLSDQALNNLMRRAEREAAIDWRKDKMRPLDPNKQTPPPELAKLSIHFRYGSGDYQYEVAWYGKSFDYTAEQRKFLRMWAELLTELPSPTGDKPIDFLSQ